MYVTTHKHFISIISLLYLMLMGLSRATGCLVYVAEKTRFAANSVQTVLSLIPKVEKKNISLIVLSVSQFWSCTETKQGVCQMSRIIVNISSILFGWLLQTRAAQAERY